MYVCATMAVSKRINIESNDEWSNRTNGLENIYTHTIDEKSLEIYTNRWWWWWWRYTKKWIEMLDRKKKKKKREKVPKNWNYEITQKHENTRTHTVRHGKLFNLTMMVLKLMPTFRYVRDKNKITSFQSMYLSLSLSFSHPDSHCVCMLAECFADYRPIFKQGILLHMCDKYPWVIDETNVRCAHSGTKCGRSHTNNKHIDIANIFNVHSTALHWNESHQWQQFNTPLTRRKEMAQKEGKRISNMLTKLSDGIQGKAIWIRCAHLHTRVDSHFLRCASTIHCVLHP